MRAAVMRAPFQINLVEVECPIPKEHEVIVRVKCAGICGSDVHFYDGSNPYANYPQIFGHELSGVIEKIGSKVHDRKVGERVVVEPAVPCGQCYPCRIGRPNACTNIQMIGSVRAGGFADFVAVPEKHVHVMSDSMPFEIGALCEPFTIGAQAIRRAKIRDHETIVILGMGPIGLTILSQIKQRYQAKTIVVDVIPERLQLAREYGADEVIHGLQQDAVQVVQEMTNGDGANIVFESAGIPQTIEQTIHLVSAAGRIVIVGLTGQDVTFPGQLLTKKDIEIHGTRHSVELFPSVLRFLDENRDIAHQFISQRMPFDEIEEALQLSKNNPQSVTKIILNY